jgi:hypothetical protein
MPRRTTYLLRWLEEKQAYELTGAGAPIVELQHLRLGNHAWFDWLEQVTSFAFAGRFGANYTVRKEKMQRGGSYWYGYRSFQGKTIKRYIGRTADLSGPSGGGCGSPEQPATQERGPCEWCWPMAGSRASITCIYGNALFI